MTWRMAKRAIDNGCRVKRPAWNGMLERHNSDDPIIYCVSGDGISTDNPYFFGSEVKKARDFEIVSQ